MSSEIKRGAALSYAIIAINMCVGVIYTPYMLRTLGQVEYGLYSLAASVIAYLTILDLGFGNAIIRYTSKFKAEGRTREQHEMFGMFLVLYSLLGLVALGVGVGLTLNADAIFGDAMQGAEVSTMRTMLILMSVNLALTLPLSLFGSIITAYENFVFQRVVSIIRILLNPLVMTLLLAMGYKAVTMVVVTTVFNLVTLLINLYYCYTKLHIKILFARPRWSFLREVSIYSMWIFLGVVMDKIYGNTGQFILGIYRDVKQVALYSVSIQLKDMFYLFSTAITGLFLPRLTQMVTRGASNEEISELFTKTGRIQYLVISTIMVGFTLLGKPFITLWAGADYTQAYLPTLLLFGASIIPLIQNMGIIVLQAQNRLKFRSLLYLAISLLSIVVAIPLAIKHGGIGCAVATSGALLLGQGLIMNIYYSRSIKLDIIGFWGQIAKMSALPILATVVGLLVLRNIAIDNITIFLGVGALFIAIYLPLMWLFMMNQSERDIIKNLVRR